MRVCMLPMKICRPVEDERSGEVETGAYSCHAFPLVGLGVVGRRTNERESARGTRSTGLIPFKREKTGNGKELTGGGSSSILCFSPPRPPSFPPSPSSSTDSELGVKSTSRKGKALVRKRMRDTSYDTNPGVMKYTDSGDSPDLISDQ
mmetsp:Transcript_38484/g.75576  ORF Transcript_38484/g.75576 Transcript_38484/m.75576 type:complete len:148 (-) Transcript_38484:413-856(-)